jgi:hypothetical protein
MNKIPIGYFNNVAIEPETNVIGPETQLNLVIDSSVNMADTKDQLDILVENDLKDLLLPFYLTEENYNKGVKVIEDSSERPYQMMGTFDLSSNNAFVFTFIDEATPYGDIYSTANANVIDDLNILVSKVSSYSKEYRGFLFRVSTESIFGESYKLSEIMYAVYNKHIPYTNTVFNNVQVPKRKENVFVNNYNVADNAFLQDFADSHNTVMTTNTKYKYYGYEIVKALNESIASINLENDSSVLQTQIGNQITFGNNNSFDYPMEQIENQITFGNNNSFDYSIEQIENQITSTNNRGNIYTHTLIGNQITFGNNNSFDYPMEQIENQITFNNNGGVPS